LQQAGGVIGGGSCLPPSGFAHLQKTVASLTASTRLPGLLAIASSNARSANGTKATSSTGLQQYQGLGGCMRIMGPVTGGHID